MAESANEHDAIDSESELNSEPTPTYRRRFPQLSMRRCSLAIVLGTLMVGQATILEQVGGFAEVQDLYQLAVWFVIIYAVWDQIEYLLVSVLHALSKKLGGEA